VKAVKNKKKTDFLGEEEGGLYRKHKENRLSHFS
jgi:hypothetical protein